MNWLDGITKDDLFESYREMFDVIRGRVESDQTAMSILLALSEHYGKQPFYFRSHKELVSERKKKFIVERFNGCNHAELARLTDFSLQYVYEILAEERSKKQCGLFGA